MYVNTESQILIAEEKTKKINKPKKVEMKIYIHIDIHIVLTGNDTNQIKRCWVV